MSGEERMQSCMKKTCTIGELMNTVSPHCTYDPCGENANRRYDTKSVLGKYFECIDVNPTERYLYTHTHIVG